MSHTFRYNPDTDKKEIERRYLKRKAEQEHQERLEAAKKKQRELDEYFKENINDFY